MAARAQDTVGRYHAYLRDERDSAALYTALAEAEQSPQLAAVYRVLAETEQRHAAFWEARLRQAGASVPAYSPGWRVRTLSWIARHLGVGSVLPVVTAQESAGHQAYASEPAAAATPMPAEERSHARVLRAVRSVSPRGVGGAVLGQLEGRHRGAGGNALRAGVLGASDGLTSNLSLVMGVAGAALASHTILLTGLAGLLAGALSMAIGEWLSVQSARELSQRQIAIEREELAAMPEEEQQELALIFQAKGLAEPAARDLAQRMMAREDSALDTLVREELGINPEELGGSAIQAAVTSFFLFAVGALAPVLPYAFLAGLAALVVSLALSVLGLFAIGLGITLTTGTPVWKAGGRQVLFGLAAAAITFGLGRLVGGALG